MGFVPSTTNNELQIIMIMKISNDINKIALAVLGMSIWPMFLHLHLSKGTCHLRVSGFCPLRGYPPPLTENHFAKKPLADRGGTPPP